MLPCLTPFRLSVRTTAPASHGLLQTDTLASACTCITSTASASEMRRTATAKITLRKIDIHEAKGIVRNFVFIKHSNL